MARFTDEQLSNVRTRMGWANDAAAIARHAVFHSREFWEGQLFDELKEAAAALGYELTPIAADEAEGAEDRAVPASLADKVEESNRQPVGDAAS